MFQGNFPASFPLLNVLSEQQDQSTREVRIVLHVQRSQASFSDDETTNSFRNDAKKLSSVSAVRGPVMICRAVGTSVITSSRELRLLVLGPSPSIWSLTVYSVLGASAARCPSATSFNTRYFEAGILSLLCCSYEQLQLLEQHECCPSHLQHFGKLTSLVAMASTRDTLGTVCCISRCGQNAGRRGIA